jgi:hypothetical protein
VKDILGFLFCLLLTKPMAQFFEQQVWVETGVKYNLTKKLGASLDLTQRYGYDGLGTLFPQVSFRYKVSSWFRPSIDYRVVRSKALDGSYSTSQRINGNLQFTYAKKRLEAGLRVRYQYSFERISAAYDSEFDQAWRIKPSVQYNIKGLPITPELSTEFFYNPENSAKGNQFNRIRYYGGADIELKHNQRIGVGVYLDQWINGLPKKRVMYSLGYSIGIATSKKTDKKPSKNLRDL